MKTLRSATLLSLITAGTALAQSAPCSEPCAAQPPAPPQPLPSVQQVPAAEPAAAQPAAQSLPAASVSDDEDNGWHRPAGQRFTSGFRMGWMYISHYDSLTRTKDNADGTTTMTSLKDEYKLKSPNMFLIGYEGFYRIVGHSWLNVLMVGNVSVAGLEQSKFIPTASGLLGFEIERQLELGVGVNLTPDTQSPSHMIVAAGWTPKVGSIQTPIHFFYIPDHSGMTDSTGKELAGNSRIGATIGMNW